MTLSDQERPAQPMQGHKYPALLLEMAWCALSLSITFGVFRCPQSCHEYNPRVTPHEKKQSHRRVGHRNGYPFVTQ